MNLNQVTLTAPDVAAAKAFYETLGLRLIVDDRPTYVRFECPEGDSTLSIERGASAAPDGPTVYFECSNLDARVMRLKEAGLHFDEDPRDQDWRWREARLRDPAGNRLCLFWAGRNRRFPPWRVASDGSAA